MAIASSSRLLGEILVEEGLTTPDVVERRRSRARRRPASSIGEALVAMGAVTEDDVLRALGPPAESRPISRATRCRRPCRS